MKVLLVCNGFPPSGQWGTEYYTHQLALGLLERDVEVLVLHPVRDGSRTRFSVHSEIRYGARVFEIANNGDARKPFTDSYLCEGIEKAFSELLEVERPDVVHFMHMFWGLSVRLPEIAKRLGVRTVVTPTDFGLICHRGQLVDWRSQKCEGPVEPSRCARCVREPGEWDLAPLPRSAQRLAANGLAKVGGLGRVVVTSDIELRRRVVSQAIEAVDHWILPTHTLLETLRTWGIDFECATQLYYGIDERKYAAPRERQPGRGTRFVYMSQYMPHKGLACLIEATRILQGRLPESVEPWSVDLYGNGTGDRHRRYAEQVLAHPLPARVTDRGPFEPLTAAKVLSQTDCVVVPSEWRENAPLTVLQARAAGVPVIAADVPGITEVLEPTRHGLFFQPGDARGLAAAMGRAVLGQLETYEPDPIVTWREHLDSVQDIHRGSLGHELQPVAKHELVRQPI